MTKIETKKSPADQRDASRRGANGVRLKRFESVLADAFSTSPSSNELDRDALETLTPRYSRLPPIIDGKERGSLVQDAERCWAERGLERSEGPDGVGVDDRDDSSPWPFDAATSLPRCGCVRGSNPQPNKQKTTKTRKGGVGDIEKKDRAWRKEAQLANLIRCVLALLPDEVRHGGTLKSRPFRIVDFGGGTGHLAVPLALLLPWVEVVCVDLKKYSLDLLHRRVDGTSNCSIGGTQSCSDKQHCQGMTTLKSRVLPNLSTYHGTIQSYSDEFDIGVSLHACGEASDWVLRKCLRQRASFAVCSCCCGKLRSDAFNPYVFQSTGENEKQIRYPRSEALASRLVGRCEDASEAFDEIARAADYGDLGDVRRPKNACRRAAKSLVEWDRLLFAREQCEGRPESDANVVLTRMVPWEASPKNDILVGWFDAASNPYRKCDAAAPAEDSACDADFNIAVRHLFGRGDRNDGTAEQAVDQNDWTAAEESEIESKIKRFLLSNEEGEGEPSGALQFPMGMGSRRRKLVHYVAERMGLRHWGDGKKDSEKVVLVAAGPRLQP